MSEKPPATDRVTVATDYILFVALRHRSDGRTVPPTDVLTRWLDEQPDDDALMAEIESVLDRCAATTSDLPDGLTAEITPSPASIDIRIGEWTTRVSGRGLVEAARRLLSADDPPSPPILEPPRIAVALPPPRASPKAEHEEAVVAPKTRSPRKARPAIVDDRQLTLF
ncbi:hypothetical protein CCP2SC5_1040006 [Azospirillaceae bacterium]